ncbi:hypothetical protein GC177_09645 [bacterium]|nr:hypothetical protein [bacterium]
MSAALIDQLADGLASGRINIREVLGQLTESALHGIIYTSIDPNAKQAATTLFTHRLTTPGAGAGRLVSSIAEAEKCKAGNIPYILFVDETSQEHVPSIKAAQAVITRRGGISSHAAILARQFDKPAMIGVGQHFTLKEGDLATLDGTHGTLYAGELPILPGDMMNPSVHAILKAAEKAYKTLDVYVNADNPEEARIARQLGAKGIGVNRTEHMFNGKETLPLMRRIILAKSAEERKAPLEELKRYQAQEFFGIMKEMDGLPVEIRLLDPPLHEFLPKGENLSAEWRARMEELHETNPMLGLRGIRLGHMLPDVYQAQIQAIAEATKALQLAGLNPMPCVMLPLVAQQEEADALQAYCQSLGLKSSVMMELPSACLDARRLAKGATYFSYGTNDLTQTMLGLSRDDTAKLIEHYVDAGIFKQDPFQTLHPLVAAMIGLSTRIGKIANPDLKALICGEQGGDPASIHVAQKLGVDGVSVSWPRIVGARFAAAQAAAGVEREATADRSILSQVSETLSAMSQALAA